MTSYDSLALFLDDWLSYRAQARTMPGFSVAVSRGSEIIYKRAFGYANILNQQALRPNDIFYIGSQSKMMTAILIMQMAEQGRLQLHDRVVMYLPWLAEHRDQRFRYVTIEQLLWHGSGLMRDGRDAGFWQLLQPFPDADALRTLILDSELLVDSASDVKYSNLGYALLGQVVERAGGATYTSQANERIIGPLGLLHTSVGNDAVANLVCGYTHYIGGRRYEIPLHEVAANTYQAVAGWRSTPEDMAKLMMVLYGENDTLLSQAGKSKLLRGERRHWRPVGPGRNEYGMGFIQQKIGAQQVYGHAGAYVTHRSCSYFNPVTEVGVAIMANSNDSPVNEMAVGLFEVVSHFATNSTGKTLQELQRFEVMLENMLGCKRIVAIGDTLEAVTLDDWFPFETAETLDVVDERTLRVARSNFLAVPGEAIVYEFRDGEVASVNYAGQQCWPRKEFVRMYGQPAQLRNKKTDPKGLVL